METSGAWPLIPASVTLVEVKLTGTDPVTAVVFTVKFNLAKALLEEVKASGLAVAAMAHMTVTVEPLTFTNGNALNGERQVAELMANLLLTFMVDCPPETFIFLEAILYMATSKVILAPCENVPVDGASLTPTSLVPAALFCRFCLCRAA